MRVSTASFALALALVGCTPPAVEAVPPQSPRCVYGGDFTNNTDQLQIEAGQWIDGRFEPLGPDTEVEVFANPGETKYRHAAFLMLLALRVTPPEPMFPSGDSVCGAISSAYQSTDTSGVVFNRDGKAWVSGSFYEVAGGDPADFDGTPAPLEYLVTLPKAGGGTLYGSSFRDGLTVRRVNKKGYFAPRPEGGVSPSPDGGAGDGQVGSLALAVWEDTVQAHPGELVGLMVKPTVTPSGAPVDLTLENPPPGISAVFHPPRIATLRVAEPEGSVAVDLAPDLAPGEYDVTVKGVAGGVEARDTFHLSVTAPTEVGYSLGLSHYNLPVTEGGELEVQLRATPLGAFTGDVRLFAALPATPGIDVALDPAVVHLTPGGPATIMVKLRADAGGLGSGGTLRFHGAHGRTVVSARRDGSHYAVVAAPETRFSISQPFGPRPLVATRGKGVEEAIQIGRTADSFAIPTLTVSDVPPGVTATLEKNPVAMSWRLRLELSATAPLGSHELRVTAAAEGKTASILVRLIVLRTDGAWPAWGNAPLPKLGSVALGPDGPAILDGQALTRWTASGWVTHAGLGTPGAASHAFSPQGKWWRLDEFEQTLRPVSVTAWPAVPLPTTEAGLPLAGHRLSFAPSLAFDETGVPTVAVRVAPTQTLPDSILVFRRAAAWSALPSPWTELELTVPVAPSLASHVGDLVLVHAAQGKLLGHRFVDGGNAWVPLAMPTDAPLVPDVGGEGLVQVALDSSSRPVVAWIASDERIHVRRLDGGTWSPLAPPLAFAPDHFAERLKLQVDAADEAVVAYQESTAVLPAGVIRPDTSFSWVKVSRTTAGAWTAVGDALNADAKGSARLAGLALDADGVPHVSLTEPTGAYFFRNAKTP